jgi:hypothetical protein
MMPVEGAGYTKAKGGARTFWKIALVVGIALIVGAVASGAYYGAILGVGAIARAAFALYGGSEKGPDPSKSGIDRIKKG